MSRLSARAALLALSAVLVPAAAACPSCASQTQTQGTLWLIFAMMGAPVVVLVAVALVVASHVPRGGP